VTQAPDSVRVETHAGLRVTGEALIGADGIHSCVRVAVAGPDAPSFSGEVVWRALIRRERLTRAAADMARFMTIWSARDRHFLHYPVRGEELLNLGGFVESDEWRSESWTETGSKSDFDRLFASFHPAVREMIDVADVCFVQAIHSRTPLARWFEGRVVLLGDALHAMPPHLGQGAGMAMEDAMVLARLMSEKGEPSEAFRAFQEARQARIESVRAAVIQAGRVYNFGSPVRGALIHGVAWAMTRLRPRPGSPQSKWLDTYDAVSG
jgi:salicylate hydroxylase